MMLSKDNVIQVMFHNFFFQSVNGDLTDFFSTLLANGCFKNTFMTHFQTKCFKEDYISRFCAWLKAFVVINGFWTHGAFV